jgi:2-dehydro-3-deoxyphosphogluconate aldolase/(4S)-4-hydroxy-2-oxoglutarate aldolase
MFTEALNSKLYQAGVIAVLVIDDAEDAAPLARALLRGGISAIELTLRTPVAMDALVRIKSEAPGILAGIGTLLNGEQVRTVKEKGAAFGVSPGLNRAVIQAAREEGLPFAPGIMTPSDIEAAYEEGCTVVKLFPSEPLGGLKFLKSLAAPYDHLGIKYIPLGGVSLENLPQYLGNPAILAVGGSWLGPRELIRKKDWDQISRNCEAASEIIARIRGSCG